MSNAEMEQKGLSLAPFSIEPVDSAGARWEQWLRRFEKFIVRYDERIKAMMLHYAGEAVFELYDAVVVVTDYSFAQAKEKLTSCFTPRQNEKYELFTFRQVQQQAQQNARETLHQFWLNFQNKIH